MQTRWSMATCMERKGGAPDEEPRGDERHGLLRPASHEGRETAMQASRLGLQQEGKRDGAGDEARHVQSAAPPGTGNRGRTEHEPERAAGKQRREPAERAM